MKRTFTYTDEKSNKFWTIEVSGSNYTVNYGKAGTAGQTQTKDFVDEAACRKAADKLIAEKIKKGYTEDGNSEIGSQKAEKTNNNEQRYFDHESHISIEEVMGRLRDWSDNYEAVEHFNEYYEENYNDCYATTDGKTITFTWCDLDDDKLEKSICIIDPNAKKATLIPSSDNEYIQEEMDGEKELSIGFPEDFLDIIKQECKNWKGEHDGKPFPFPKLPKRPKAKYAFELPSFTVEKRKGDSIPDISKFYSYRYCPNDEEWVIHTPKEKQIILRAKGKKFKMFFDTNEKAIATACKIVMKRMIVDKARFSDDDKAFTLADVKQTVYLYEKQQQGGTAGSYATTVYDPTSHGLIFLEAIRTGNTDFVKLCLENGANPVESIEIKKSQSRRPMSLAIEVNQPEILKMLIKHAFNY